MLDVKERRSEQRSEVLARDLPCLRIVHDSLGGRVNPGDVLFGSEVLWILTSLAEGVLGWRREMGWCILALVERSSIRLIMFCGI